MQRNAWRVAAVALMVTSCLSPLMGMAKALADTGASTTTAPLVPVTFQVTDNTTFYGQNVYIVGSIPQLGDWSAAQAVGPMNASSWPVWSETVDIPAGTTFQYKYIEEPGNSGAGSVTWSGGNNLEYVVPPSGSGATDDTWVAPGGSSPALTLLSDSLPTGYQTDPYSAQLESEGGDPGYAYSVVAGSIAGTASNLGTSVPGAVYGAGQGTYGGPSGSVTGDVYTTLGDGLVLTGGGLITGTPVGAGTLSFTADVTDAAGASATRQESLTIDSSAISLAPASLQAGFTNGTTVTVTGMGTDFSSGQTTVSLTDSAGTSTDLTSDATVDSPTQLTVALPGGAAGLGAGAYTLVVSSGSSVESAPLNITPYTDASTVQWDGVFTSQAAPYLSNPNPAPGTDVTVGFRAYSGNLTSATLNWYDTAQSKAFSVAMTPGATFGPYQMWTATIPASDGGVLYYRFDLYDGTSTACLAGDGLHAADTTNNNLPIPTGGLSFDALHITAGDVLTANDPEGDFSGGATTFSYLNADNQVVGTSTAEGSTTSWNSVSTIVPATLPDGLYTVDVTTTAVDGDGVVNTELSRSSLLAVGPLHYWFDDLKHDSFNSFYRSPFGAVPQGTAITLRLRGPLGLTNPEVRLWNAAGNPNETDIPMQPVPLPSSVIAAQTGDNASDYSWWQATIPASDVTTLANIWYQFEAQCNGQTVYYDDNGAQLEGVGQAGFSDGGPSYQISVYQDSFQTPSWLRHAVIYEIFPDRFFNGNIANDENPNVNTAVGTLPDGQEGLVPVQFHTNWYSQPYDPAIVATPGDANYANELRLRGDGQWNMDFFGGDLQGIDYKLDYLKSLGVNTLYLTPIFQSDSVHKYDTGNFLEVDPGFGTMQDWLNLVKDAKARGMHILIDGAFEDTGSDSVYFNKFGNYPSVGAWQQEQNPSVQSPYYSWYDWTGNPAQPYNSWFGYDTLPLTNTSNPSYQQFVYGGKSSVAEYWIENGASGWRLDSADNGNFSIPWWSAFRSAVKSVDPQAAIVGEIWNNATNDNGTNWLTGQTFDSVMNYQFRNAVIDFFRGAYNDGNEQHTAVDATGFNARLMRLYSEYPLTSFYAMMNLVDSQDTMRILSVLSDAPDPTTMTAYQQASWQPTASELALGIARLKLVSDFQFGFPGDPTVYYGDEAGMLGYKDPLNRGPYPWGQENEDLVNHYRLLGAIRSANPVLQTGAFEPLLAQGDVYAFARTITGGQDVFGTPTADATAIVALNNQATPDTITVPVNGTVPDGTQMEDELTGTWYTVSQGQITMNLAAYQGVILIANPSAPVAYMQRSGAQTEIAWTPVAAANAHYQVWMEDSDGTWRSLPLAPMPALVGPASGSVVGGVAAQPLSADITGLRGTQAMQLMVSATVPGQPPVGPASAAVPANNPPQPPLPPGSTVSNVVTVPAVDLTIGSVTATTTPHGVQLSFSAVPGATQYTVYAEQPDGSYTLVDTVSVGGPVAAPGSGGVAGALNAPAPGGPLAPMSPPMQVMVSGITATTFRVAAANEDDIVYSSPVTVTPA